MKELTYSMPSMANQQLGSCGCRTDDRGNWVVCAEHEPEWRANIQRFADRIDADLADQMYRELYADRTERKP